MSFYKIAAEDYTALMEAIAIAISRLCDRDDRLLGLRPDLSDPVFLDMAAKQALTFGVPMIGDMMGYMLETPIIIVRRCDGTKSVDGASASERVPCDGRYEVDGNFVGGCGEPCAFVMRKQGHGIPPWPEGAR